MRQSFRKWLLTRRGRNDRIGDLANDIFQDIEDDCMPEAARSFEEIAEHILVEHHSCCDGCQEALKAANRGYKRRR